MPARMSGQQPQPAADPVQGALAYGRRKAGLPVDFEQGHTTPSFDDGGVVPDPSAAPPQPQATDPQQLLKYLSGDGALSPDVVMAMEAMADPDSSMDATDRMSAVLGKAPSPDVAFGYLQHCRTKYNGHCAASRVAADKGDYAKAAMHANKAHENVPGSRKRFAPVPGGVHMVNGSATQEEPQEEAYAQGGSVDSSNPNDDNGYTDDTGEENAYADGGEVDTRYDDFPDSDNIEDRRHEHGEGWAGKGDGPDPDSGSINGSSIPDLNRWNEGKAKEGERKEFERNSGVVRKQSFADGGEVEEDNTYGDFLDQSTDESGVTAAVTPRQSDDDLTTGATPPMGSPEGQRPAVATNNQMLSPEDLSRVMSLGWDSAVTAAKPPTLEDAANERLKGLGRTIWGGVKKGVETLSNMDPYSDRPVPGTPPAAPKGVLPTDQAEREAAGDSIPGARNSRTMVDSGEEAEASMSGYDPVTRQKAAAPAGSGAPDQGPADPDAGYKKDRQHANERRDEMLAWLKQRANELWPGNWSHDNERRNNYIEHGMERFFGQDLSRENNIRADKAGVAERGIQAKALEGAETRRVREESNVRNNETRKQVAAFNQTQQGQRFQQGQLASTLRAQIMAGADITDPKVTAGVRQAFEQTTGHKIDQNDHDTIKEILGLNRSIVKPQGQTNGSPPPDAPIGQLWTDPNGVLRVKSEKGWGRA